ncbi:hypothetical protein V2P57_01945 [Mycoplasma mycoides subsp. mycoides]|uniref:Uncharacterized protein n=1 Tax=Mycoplasma mycoides subsp. mycoides TaxID=2103 RepID=A0AAE2JTY2_MYCMY|nr:hypothetical protein [Mycoplasma mycoides]ADK69749.1 conserved hypothetical protein [Mycoplasma mycoides subsp. mycoides SC str. Gladysdale]AIZ55241.1 hypothetical protein mycmycITA_00414 [Mycoplasma mycoides subsp. mycoides]AME10587.1 hypothetical protein MmmBen_0415 [Mycoplasma mycoides subsp. mycoides]AME11594.1 hypothetical protein MmmBen50_0407 [Mycoplasma mycoides subsp. mycoides]AME12622.1 hypothetical protein MmmBen181_0432 [Mycoplasma mycoides subsp. mycoides]
MTEYELITTKLNELIKMSRKKELSQDQLFDICIYLTNVIDDVLLKKNLKDDLINQNDQFYYLLYLLKTLLAILFTRNAFFNFDIFNKLNPVLLFYIKQSLDHQFYDDPKKNYLLENSELHSLTSMYLYVFSIFNKLIKKINYLNLKYNLKPNIEEYKRSSFINDFTNLSYAFFKTRGTQYRSEQFFLLLKHSWIFNHLLEIKTNLDNSDYLVNLVFELECLFIIICRIFIQITLDFKTNYEINKLLEINSTNL